MAPTPQIRRCVALHFQGPTHAEVLRDAATWLERQPGLHIAALHLDQVMPDDPAHDVVTVTLVYDNAELRRRRQPR